MIIMTRRLTTQPTIIAPHLLLISGQSISPVISLNPSPLEMIQIRSPACTTLDHLRHLQKNPKVTRIMMWSTAEVIISLQATTLRQNTRTLMILLLPHRNRDPNLGPVKTHQTSQYFWGRATLTLLLGAAAHHLMFRKSRAIGVMVESISTPTKLMTTQKLPVVIILADRWSICCRVMVGTEVMHHRVRLLGKKPHLYLFISLTRTRPKALGMGGMVTTLHTAVLAVTLLGGLCMLPQP